MFEEDETKKTKTQQKSREKGWQRFFCALDVVLWSNHYIRFGHVKQRPKKMAWSCKGERWKFAKTFGGNFRVRFFWHPPKKKQDFCRKVDSVVFVATDIYGCYFKPRKCWGVNDCQLLLRNAFHIFCCCFWLKMISVFLVDVFSHVHPRKFGRDIFTQFEEHMFFQMGWKHQLDYHW